jgi:hypothetical protein
MSIRMSPVGDYLLLSGVKDHRALLSVQEPDAVKLSPRPS